MKIEQLIEALDEAFNDMSQKATSIAQNAAANTASADRMAKIDLLKQQQAARTAAGIKRPPAALAKPGTAPATTAPAATTPAAVPPGQAQAAPAATTPATTNKPGVADVAQNFIGKAGDVAGSVAGAVAAPLGGFVGGLRRGYNAQSGQSNGSYTPRGGAAGGGAAGGGAAPELNTSGVGLGHIQDINARLAALEKRLATTAESFKFESKFLGMKI